MKRFQGAMFHCAMGMSGTHPCFNRIKVYTIVLIAKGVFKYEIPGLER